VPQTAGSGPPHIAVDSQRQVAYITDDACDSIVALNLPSGYRQIVAK
jgi:hypothetical protein